MNLHSLILLAAETAVAQTTEHAVSGGVIGTLGINWKLLLAQLVNFSVILFVLWRWVFRPVAGALEKRRERVQESVKQAENIELRAKDLEKTYAENLKKSRMEAEAILKKTEAEANKLKDEIVAAAKREAEKINAQAKQTLESERKQMWVELRAEVANLTVLASEKVLREKLDDKRDKEFVRSVLEKIE